MLMFQIIRQLFSAVFILIQFTSISGATLVFVFTKRLNFCVGKDIIFFLSLGFVRLLVVDLWSALECGSGDARVVRPKPTPMDSIDRSCLKVSAWTEPAQNIRELSGCLWSPQQLYFLLQMFIFM